MRFSATFATFALLFAPALAVPAALKTVLKSTGPVKAGSYIVKYKDGASFTDSSRRAGVKVTEEYDASFFNGFAAEMDDDSLNAFRADSNVEFIEEDGIMNAFAVTTQTNAPWGLSRISQDARVSGSVSGVAFTYRYDSTAGAGVDVYVADTGVYTAHSDFGGRARHGYSASGFGTADGNGHGTHCAGTIAGTRYGVAKRANIIAVKILSDSGSGATAGIVAGLNWVATNARSTGRPSVVSMSLGGGVSTALDQAVATLTAAGIHVVVAAGNSNVDAANTSPARSASAITVGSSTITDVRSSFSNYGAVVDVFAPGTSVISTWIGSTSATNSISGTSMATPHVAGLAAYLIGLNGNSSPAALQTTIKSLAVKGVLTSIPSGTVNNLASNNI